MGNLKEMLKNVLQADDVILHASPEQVAEEWIEEGFEPEEAKEWWKAGCFNPYSAGLLKHYGYSPKGDLSIDEIHDLIKEFRHT